MFNCLNYVLCTIILSNFNLFLGETGTESETEWWLEKGKLHEYRFKRTFFSIKQTFYDYQSLKREEMGMTLPQRAKRSYTTSTCGGCRSLMSKVYNVFAYKPFLSWLARRG